jgi:uncharacterized protein (DUF1330 family)
MARPAAPTRESDCLGPARRRVLKHRGRLGGGGVAGPTWADASVVATRLARSAPGILVNPTAGPAPDGHALAALRGRGERFDRYLPGVAVRVCVLLTAIPGREVLLGQYEDRVLGLLPDHGARVDARVRALEGPLTEIQILEFPSEQALVDFQNDPRRTDLTEIRNAVIASTTVIRVESTTTA